MSIKTDNVNSRENQTRRLRIKTLDQQMKRVVVEGTGISPWEAEVLVNTINEVYFTDPELEECAYSIFCVTSARTCSTLHTGK